MAGRKKTYADLSDYMHIRLPKGLKAEFVKACKDKSLLQSEIIRDWIRDYAEANASENRLKAN